MNYSQVTNMTRAATGLDIVWRLQLVSGGPSFHLVRRSRSLTIHPTIPYAAINTEWSPGSDLQGP